ncbi:MAG: WD40 repeat domain-containing protein, partial [Bacteroidota bacterium]
ISTDYSGAIRGWDSLTKRKKLDIPATRAYIGQAHYGVNGRSILTRSDTSVQLWDRSYGLCFYTWETYSFLPEKLTIAPKGNQFVIQDLEGELYLFQAIPNSTPIPLTPPPSNPLLGIGFSLDGRYIYGFSKKERFTWDVENRSFAQYAFPEEASRFKAYFQNRSGIHFLQTEEGIHILDAAFQPQKFLSVKTDIFSSRYEQIDTNPEIDQMLLVSWGMNEKGDFELRNINSSEDAGVFKAHSSSAFSATFNHTGTKILSGSGDKTAILWDVATQQPLFTLKGHSHTVNDVAFHPTEDELMTAGDSRIMLWNEQDGTRTQTMEFVPGLWVQGWDFRGTQHDFSEEDINLLRMHGAIFNEADAERWQSLVEQYHPEN